MTNSKTYLLIAITAKKCLNNTSDEG